LAGLCDPKEDEGMRNAILISVLSAVLVAGAASVYAGPPLNGVYKSSLGQFDEGREASTWVGGGFLTNGNVIHLLAYDGAVLGGDWRITCPYVINVSLVVDLVFGGNGSRIYQITYAGGTFSLGGSGGQPWANGDASYTGVLTDFTELRTLIFSGGVMVGSDSDFNFNGQVNGYSQSCLQGIANGAWLGNGVAPAGYPTNLNANCAAGGSGHWADTRDLTLTIAGCSVATQPATWGTVKSMYRD
jgi:hypothetical protein